MYLSFHTTNFPVKSCTTTLYPPTHLPSTVHTRDSSHYHTSAICTDSCIPGFLLQGRSQTLRPRKHSWREGSIPDAQVNRNELEGKCRVAWRLHERYKYSATRTLGIIRRGCPARRDVGDSPSLRRLLLYYACLKYPAVLLDMCGWRHLVFFLSSSLK